MCIQLCLLKINYLFYHVSAASGCDGTESLRTVHHVEQLDIVKVEKLYEHSVIERFVNYEQGHFSFIFRADRMQTMVAILNSIGYVVLHGW